MSDNNISSSVAAATPVSTDATVRTIQFTVPLRIRIELGAAGVEQAVSVGFGPAAVGFETRKPAPRTYTDRNGYDPAFLAGTSISFESLLAPITDRLAPTIDQKTVLTYRNFSVAMHRIRRLSVATAVNIDGQRTQSMGRSDVWILDPRLNETYQTGPEVYANNDLDRGHMVRRLDPVWGAQAQQANDDTFHYTNSCPQHAGLNQKAWADLEDYILNNTKLAQLKVSVFTGPVFGEADIPYRGVLLPLQFWKVAAVIKKDGELSMTGYLLSQKSLLVDLREGIAEDGFGAFRTYQVPLSQIQALTELDFSPYFSHDPLHRAGAGRFEVTTDLREIQNPDDLIL